jgi:hypothetical protein
MSAPLLWGVDWTRVVARSVHFLSMKREVPICLPRYGGLLSRASCWRLLRWRNVHPFATLSHDKKRDVLLSEETKPGELN